jgi:apolipoprotein N-acyltransferase
VLRLFYAEETTVTRGGTIARFAVAVAGGVALALAFPKVDQPWLAPVGFAALFWAWQRLSLRDAFLSGWLAGTAFYLISFSWFSYTVGSMVGRFSFALVLLPAAIEALGFGVAALAAAFAFRRAAPATAAVAAAAAFAAVEWLRSIGFTGVPLAQIGYTQVDTPLGLFGAYIGTVGVTFVAALVGAVAATALAQRRARMLVAPAITLLVAWIVCWALWPARHVDRPTVSVAAIQGNIAQSVKWNATVFQEALARYTALSTRAAQRHPQLILWPETSVTTYLDADPATLTRLSRLAASLRTTLIIGTLTSRNGHDYNSLYVFAPDGTVRNIYDKRQLVPFVEKLPARNVLSALPGANLVGRFESGTDDAVWSIGSLRFAPLICWESAFADRTYAQVRRGAQVLLIATDDAWFGETSGPFQHAEIARMRAIENGAWVLRAAQTGVSGIIRPDGRWTERVGMTQAAAITGSVGAGVGSVFAHIGPTPIGILLILTYAALVLIPPLLLSRARR